MKITVVEIHNRASRVRDALGRVFPIWPATYPYWVDHRGNLYNADDFDWELP